MSVEDELRAYQLAVRVTTDIAGALKVRVAAADIELDAVRQELRDTSDLNGRLGGLLTGVANALKGEPDPLTLHSWHDLPEQARQGVVARAVAEAERDALRTRVEALESECARLRRMASYP
jgi:hypothetical protein